MVYLKKTIYGGFYMTATCLFQVCFIYEQLFKII